MEEKKEKKKKSPGTPFEKGKSGNPGGRPKTPKWAITKIKGMVPDAIEQLGEILLDPYTKTKDRIKAIEIILNYGLGKPEQVVNLSAEVKQDKVTTVKFEGVLDEWSK